MPENPKKRDLSPEAERALKEAEERRQARERDASKPEPQPEPEIGGPKGPDPVRHGDWEKDGIASDF